MSVVLLTGGTGTLGRSVERALEARAHEVRVLSRERAPRDRAPGTWVRGDLAAGVGLEAAVHGVDTIVHCATSPRGGDAESTRRLVEAATAARVAGSTVPHIVYISIVGVDRIPMFYYREKLAAERVVVDSGLPWTIVRSTQFHNVVLSVFASQRHLPIVLAPSVRLQPIDVRDVAEVLAGLVDTGPVGRAPDIGGPEILPAAELARATLESIGARRRVAPLRLPGKLFSALAAGHNLAPDNPVGTRTFAEFLEKSSNPE